MQDSIGVLELLVDKNSIQVTADKADILKSSLKPDSATELRSFLELLQFFRIFIHHISKTAASLIDLTKKILVCIYETANVRNLSRICGEKSRIFLFLWLLVERSCLDVINMHPGQQLE